MTAAPSEKEKLPLSRGQLVVRILGVLLLTACAAMLVLGLTVWAERWHGPQFVLYWTWCFVLALAAIIVALWDMVLVRRSGKRSKRELFRSQFMTEEFAQELRSKPDDHDEKS